MFLKIALIAAALPAMSLGSLIPVVVTELRWRHVATIEIRKHPRKGWRLLVTDAGHELVEFNELDELDPGSLAKSLAAIVRRAASRVNR